MLFGKLIENDRGLIVPYFVNTIGVFSNNEYSIGLILNLYQYYSGRENKQIVLTILRCCPTQSNHLFDKTRRRIWYSVLSAAAERRHAA